MPAHDGDLFRTHAFRRDDTAQTNCAISNDGNFFTWPDLRRYGRMMTGSHHVGKRKQGWHQLVVLNLQTEQCSIRLRNAHRFGLGSADPFAVAEEPAVHARGLETFVTELTCAVRERKRHDDEVAALNRPNVSAYIFNHADGFMSHGAPGLAVFHLLVGPKIAAANAGATDANDCVGWLNDFRV